MVITFWLGADSEKEALTMCADKGIVEIESIEDATNTHPWKDENNVI